MKIRYSVALALVVACAASAANAQNRYWDGGTINIVGTGNGVSLGTLGNWSTAISNWDQGAGLAYVPWDNAGLNTAVFGGTAGSVT